MPPFVCFMLLLVLVPVAALAEGTKQLRPTSADSGVVVISHNGAPGGYGTFGLTHSTPDNRICFSIASASEKVMFGMNWQYLKLGSFRISNTAGVVVYDTTPVPVAGTGFIATYNQAAAGPAPVAVGGYSPFVFFPPAPGDYYLEFMDTVVIGSNPPDPVLLYFDLTVTDAANNPINGRLWSKNWYLSTMHDYAHFNGSLFVYSSDQIVTRIGFNGMQPHLFRIGCNHNGCNNYQPFTEARKSRTENSVYPEYKIFFNNPDPALFPTGNPGSISQVSLDNPCNGSVNLNVAVTQPGTVSVMVGINPVPGYQPEDVNLVQAVTTGTNTLTWNGLNGLGTPVPNGTPVTFDITYINGLTNLPLYDIEIQAGGFVVDLIRPAGERPLLYWDDRLLTAGTVQLDGCLAPPGCHTWGLVTGDTRTINTWWYAFTVEWPTLNHVFRRPQTRNIAEAMCPSDSLWFNNQWLHGPGNYTYNGTAALGCDSTVNLTLSMLAGPLVNLGNDTTVCQQGSLLLDAGTGFSYLWNNGSTNSTLLVTATGTYSVTATAPNGCTHSDEIEVTIAPTIGTKAIRHE